MGRANGDEVAVELAARGMEKKVAIDWDGTVYPLLDAMCLLPEVTDEMREQLRPQACNHWDVPVNLMGLEALDRARTVEMMQKVGVIPGFFEAIDELVGRGYEPVILTHNSEEAAAGIAEYLRSQGREIEVIRARPAEKISWCKENNCPLLFDDSPETIGLGAEAGVTIVTFRYIYNSEAIDTHGALHVPYGSSWLDLVRLGLDVLERHHGAVPA